MFGTNTTSTINYIDDCDVDVAPGFKTESNGSLIDVKLVQKHLILDLKHGRLQISTCAGLLVKFIPTVLISRAPIELP
jgi:hypothetical protein